MRGKSAGHMKIIGTKNDWGTDKEVFEKAKIKYDIHPTLDVCATKENKMCENYFGIDHLIKNKRDGLTQSFKEPFFMNCPYDPDYQCNGCGAINSFDWELIYKHKSKKDKEIRAFMSESDNSSDLKEQFRSKGFVYSHKVLACVKCRAGNSHRETLHKGVTDWIKKAYSEHLTHNVDAMILTFAKTDTKWWHKYIEGKAEVHFIEGRLRFLDNGKISAYPAPYGSCWIIYRAK